jgi:transaldolase
MGRFDRPCCDWRTGVKAPGGSGWCSARIHAAGGLLQTTKSDRAMNHDRQLHALGQSLWLDNISRRMLDDGTLAHYVRDLSVTGLTSNPSIFEKAIVGGGQYDAAIRARGDDPVEAVFFDLALDDLRRAADLFRPVHERSGGVDGWVSLEVSPLLADDAEKSIAAAFDLHQRARLDNLFIKIPGTAAGARAIEETIFSGVPVNVTLLFSSEQYVMAAQAWMRGIERRIAAGLDPAVDSVASLFVSRWDAAIQDSVPAVLRNRVGIAIAQDTYRVHRQLLESPRVRALIAAGARPQRLLWASTGTKDATAPDTLYVEALIAPGTINTMPDKTLQAFADHGRIGAPMPADGGDSASILKQLADAGIHRGRLAERLQREGALAFVKSWQQLLAGIRGKRRRRGIRSIAAHH